MKWLLLFSVTFVSLHAKPLDISTRAKAVLVMNAETGAIIYEKNGFQLAYPASTTKLATALYVLEEKQADLQKIVQVSAEAVKRNPGKRTDDTPSHWLETDATIMGIAKGEKLTLDSLLHGLLMVSGNDAANAIGETVSGSVPRFVDELNAYVHRIGCKNTHFTNPHGYHHPNHLSTPHDLCLIMKKGLENPLFREIVGKSSYLRPKTNKRAEEEIKSSNWLVDPARKFFYPKAIGGKTGFYSLAGWCLVEAATHEGRTLIACVLGCQKNTERFEEVRRIFDIAFAEKKVERLFVPGSQRFTKEVPGSSTKLTACLSKNLSMGFYPSEEPEVKAYIHWTPPPLPIKKGAMVGEVRIVDEKGAIIATEALFSTELVSSSFLASIKETWNRLFR